ncbi:MAG: hypothetical protein KatS3mg087_1736 [Patescibacteria group bacterium]|nr:MAG: hypothetical protein KatS3mg087_1736 [Patescibacteria group bacterium]
MSKSQKPQATKVRPWGGLGARRKLEHGGVLSSGIVVDADGNVSRVRTIVNPEGRLDSLKVGVVDLDKGTLSIIEPEVVGSTMLNTAKAVQALDEVHKSRAESSKLSAKYVEKLGTAQAAPAPENK